MLRQKLQKKAAGANEVGGGHLLCAQTGGHHRACAPSVRSHWMAHTTYGSSSNGGLAHAQETHILVPMKSDRRQCGRQENVWENIGKGVQGFVDNLKCIGRKEQVPTQHADMLLGPPEQPPPSPPTSPPMDSTPGVTYYPGVWGGQRPPGFAYYPPRDQFY